MIDAKTPSPAQTPAPASASARPDVGMVFETLLASRDPSAKEMP
jgi:hypothetical protein